MFRINSSFGRAQEMAPSKNIVTDNLAMVRYRKSLNMRIHARIRARIHAYKLALRADRSSMHLYTNYFGKLAY